jgi:hypothetical protein
MKLKTPTAEMNALLRKSGSNNYGEAVAAQRELATALTLPLRQGVLKGDIVGGIFQPIKFEPGASVEFPLDFLAPGTEKSFIAYTIPNVGRMPERHVEGDYVMVPTYDVGATIDWALKYARDARWDIVGRAMQVLEAMFVRKNNDDGWRTILAAGVGRNLVTYDDQATSGMFSKRLIALMETVMRRSAGGNSASLNKGKLTDVWMSPESHQDVLSWDLTQVPDALRNTIYQNWESNGVTKIGAVTLHDIDELGVAQDYQKVILDPALGGTLPSDKVEFVVGLDLQNNDSFVRPIRAEVEVFEDPTFHRQRRAGVYGFGEGGWSCLDNRRVLFGAV